MRSKDFISESTVSGICPVLEVFVTAAERNRFHPVETDATQGGRGSQAAGGDRSQIVSLPHIISPENAISSYLDIHPKHGARTDKIQCGKVAAAIAVANRTYRMGSAMDHPLYVSAKTE